MNFNYEKIKKESEELAQKYIQFIEKKYKNENDIIPENEYDIFFKNNASQELQEWEKNRKDKYKQGIIID